MDRMDAPAKGTTTTNNDCSACMSRRDLLRGGIATVGLAAVSVSLLGALPTACMPSNAQPDRPIGAGTVADIQVGTLKLIDGQSVILGRDLGGLYAMTRICTHQGALVGLVSVAGMPALHCSAHGSEFSMYGEVTHGPAMSALEHLLVEVVDGDITIHPDQAVSAETRTAAAG
jgi:nitrite reductase/ring-hydroxylating ferredoxin subunit